MELTQENLQTFGEYAQEILNISHWNIKYTLCDKKEMFYENQGQGEYQGLATKQREILYANIILNADSEYEYKSNWMQTVIHELIHIIMDDYDAWVEDHFEEKELPDYGNTLYEKTVEWLARGVYRAMVSNCPFILPSYQSP